MIAHNYQAELDEEAAQDPNVENKGHLLRDVCQRLPAVVAVKMLKAEIEKEFLLFEF